MHSREHSYDSKSLSIFALSLGGLLQLFVSVLNVKIFMMAMIIILYAEWNFNVLVIFFQVCQMFHKEILKRNNGFKMNSSKLSTANI